MFDSHQLLWMNYAEDGSLLSARLGEFADADPWLLGLVIQGLFALLDGFPQRLRLAVVHVPQRGDHAAGESARGLRTNTLSEFQESIREAPFVVVPGEDLDLVADELRERCVEDRRVRIADDVGGHKGGFRVGKVGR